LCADSKSGDTDSLFVKLPGRSVKEAFAFGREFCDAVTLSNPPPGNVMQSCHFFYKIITNENLLTYVFSEVQLKLEKVYMGTLLQTVCQMK
jgi:DNA polymerase elongation subunit (family B)